MEEAGRRLAESRQQTLGLRDQEAYVPLRVVTKAPQKLYVSLISTMGRMDNLVSQMWL